MRKHHPGNERIKRQYFIYLEEAKRMAQTSIDQVAAAIATFEALTKYRDFKKFHIEQARLFKRQLREQINPKTGRPLAKATINTRLKALRAFFIWLAGQPGFRSKLSYSDADYFNDSNHNEHIAAAIREKRVPTIEQIRLVFETMPDETDIEKRNRALVTFALLSGARDNAIASLCLKHVDVEKRVVIQDAREVRTKFRKTFTSWFFPVGDDIEEIVIDWIAYLKSEKLFGPDDPLFPATKIARGENGLFGPVGLDRVQWKSAGAIRKIFKQAFESAGLPYYNPHSFRNTLTLLGEKKCRTPEDFKIWSQNLGHEKVLTTFTSYGAVSSHRQAEIMEELRHIDGSQDAKLAASEPDRLANVERMLEKLTAGK